MVAFFQLIEFKGHDRTTTLLHYLIQQIMRVDPNLAKFHENMLAVVRAADLESKYSIMYITLRHLYPWYT